MSRLDKYSQQLRSSCERLLSIGGCNFQEFFVSGFYYQIPLNDSQYCFVIINKVDGDAIHDDCAVDR